jgi:hypothetical protein
MLSASVSSSMLYSVSLHSGRLAGYLRDLRSRSAICNTTVNTAGLYPSPDFPSPVVEKPACVIPNGRKILFFR